MRRQKVLLISALVLTVANLVALPHTLVALAELGGGAASPGPGKGCGCSGGSIPMNESQLKQRLASNAQLVHREGLQQRFTYTTQQQPPCPDATCERKGPFPKQSCRPKTCIDRQTQTQYANTVHTRNKFIWYCTNGAQYVWCDEWRPVDGDCCKWPSDAPCDGGSPGQILCNWNSPSEQ